MKDQLPQRFGKCVAHFYTEQERVLKGATACKKGNIEEFCRLMFESDNSSFCQQETGIAEMKSIYEILKDAEGVYGARASGALYNALVSINKRIRLSCY
ncbi:hypothetical protein [Aerococcus urinaeequi]|uniref:hypothetical protein n=1 Tax=Aerococcus urinaeequi TaxID=51665 RepID=UPI003D6A4D91